MLRARLIAHRNQFESALADFRDYPINGLSPLPLIAEPSPNHLFRQSAAAMYVQASVWHSGILGQPGATLPFWVDPRDLTAVLAELERPPSKRLNPLVLCSVDTFPWSSTGVFNELLPGLPCDVEYLSTDYRRLILDAGGLPVFILDLPEPSQTVAAVLAHLQPDAVVLSSGLDIPQQFYSPATQVAEAQLLLTSPRKIINLRALFLAAKRRRIPSLGVCRGMQAMGVFMDARLYPHIEGHRNSLDLKTGVMTHRVEILTEDPLFSDSPVGKQFWANSLHHQALDDKLTEWILPLARSVGTLHDCIEAIRLRDRKGLLPMWGIQFHLEKSTCYDAARFRRFLELAREASPY